MTALRSTVLALALPLAAAGFVRAESPTIEHSAIKCLVAGKYRKFPARFAPEEVAQPRVYFRPEGVPSWYYVEMKPEAPLGHVGVLPKATKKLVGKKIEYYVEAASRDFDTGRTPEYGPTVVAKDSDCADDPVVALYSQEPPSAVFPSVPQGFAIGGGVGGGTIAAVIGGGAAAGGAAIALTRDDDETAPPPVQPTPAPTPSPVITPTPPPPTAPPLDVACQADPRQGAAPLQVKFNSQATLGPNASYAWDFGDGGTSNQINPSHTYTVPGTYLARLVVTSGSATDNCSRTITVLARSFRLQVALAGSGTGRVTGDGIDCPGDCSEEYAPGTSVALSAAPTGTSTFGGWSGDCSGTGACTLNMDRDRSATATFNAPATFPLNVTVGGTGTGNVTGPGIGCPGDCSESYPAGTGVTLTANPTGGSSFVWGGDCTGTTGGSCNLTMSAARNASVTFTTLTFQLVLTVNGPAFGTPSFVEYQGTTIPDCLEGNVCTTNHAPGTILTLVAMAQGVGGFQSWGEDCSLAVTEGGFPTCTLVMNQNHRGTANFAVITVPPVSRGAVLVSRLDVAGARAQATLNGALLSEPRPGVSSVPLTAVAGENRLEAQLIEAGRSGGTWTLDLSGVPALVRGSLRVTAGEATAVGPDSVVFRLSGRAGERVGIAFTAR